MSTFKLILFVAMVSIIDAAHDYSNRELLNRLNQPRLTEISKPTGHGWAATKPTKPTGHGWQVTSPPNPDHGWPVKTWPPTPPNPVECAAALNCTKIEYCTAHGVISEYPVVLTAHQEAYRAPLTNCLIEMSGELGKCCRDPHHVDTSECKENHQW